MNRFFIPTTLLILLLLASCGTTDYGQGDDLIAILDEDVQTISIFRKGASDPILVQNARSDHRPYLHPIVSPDGNGLVTEYSPGHHKHQTGLYWGFTRVNGEYVNQDSVKAWFYEERDDLRKRILGRDYFHNVGQDYWQRVGFSIIKSEGSKVEWETTYHMLDENGDPIMEERQHWSMQIEEDAYLIDLEWKGKALVDIVIGEFEYGGLFLRMPWKEGIEGEVVNFARQVNDKAEGQRALWVDVGMKVEGRQDLIHVALFDHSENSGFPQTWRVDGQLGVGPVRARMGDWKIPSGEVETIKHRMVVYPGAINDLDLTEKWKKYVGDDNIYATAGLWGIAQEEGRKAKFLTAEEAVDEMTVKPGFLVNAWASEPMITQPMAFCWDDRGRMWIAENRDYESRGEGFSGSGDSRILIIEDTDKDGRADKRTVFAEGIPFPSALAVGFDGVFVGAPPNLLFIPDKDGDDKGDMDDIEVRLTGWGIRDRHETVNSFHWGPDGWLYGLEGFATPSVIRKPNGNGKLYGHNDPFPEDLLDADGVDINGGVWRYHPTKDKFEVVAHGFSNPWGIDYDAKGQLLITACVIPHMFHVIPGGIYHRQGGQHFNPYVYDDIQTIVDHRHRSAHGGARVYLSDAFPEEHYGRIFMANIHEHAVLSDVLTRKGSGYVASHGEDFLMANNAQWVGFSIEIGPEGGLYVLDWHDADICGSDVMNKETGRVFRVTPENSQAEDWEGRYDDLRDLTDLELAKLQLSPSIWHVRRARIILQGRAARGPIAEVAEDFLVEVLENHDESDRRLKALWTLHAINQADEALLMKSLNDQDEYIRGWSIQLSCEDLDPSEQVLEKMVEMAENDPSAIVRLYLAAALQRIPEKFRWEVGKGLMTRSEDVLDHNIPKMIWFGLESVVGSDIERGLVLAVESELPILSNYIARRAVSVDAIPELLEIANEVGRNQKILLEGLFSELESRTDLDKPAVWDKVYANLKDDEELGSLVTEIAQLFGDAEAASKLMEVVKNKDASAEERKSALNSLASRKWHSLPSLFEEFLSDPVLKTEVIRAVAQYSEKDLGWMIFENYESFTRDQKNEAIQTLSSRREYAFMLANGIKEGWFPREEVPIYIARQLRRVMGNGFVEIWGPIDDISANVEADYSKYKELLSAEVLSSADLVAGKEMYRKSCGACHQLFGEGGNLGPELTGSNRTNLDYLLQNMIEPNAVIQEEYRMVVVTVRDGRTYLGNIASENDRQLVLKVVGQDRVVINKSDIQSREETPNSMMPAGQLNNMTEDEVINLVAYLQSQESI